jgi:hypothetical protein
MTASTDDAVLGTLPDDDWRHPGPFIFIVTVFTRVKPKLVAINGGPNKGSIREHQLRDTRTWGWFQTLEDASEALRINDGDMHETTYDLAVVEKTGWGSMAMAEEETWFAFDRAANEGRGGYVPAGRPADLDGVVGFGMG